MNEVEINIKSIFYNLTSIKHSSIDWLEDNEEFQVKAGETFVVLSRPRSKWINLIEQINEDINAIKNEKGKKVILYSNDVLNYSNFFTTLLSANKPSELSFLIVPFSAEELEEEVINKMKKARTYRA